MTTPDPNAFLMGGGISSAKFETPGDTVTGTIASPPQVRQQTDFATGDPLVWQDGTPRMQLVVQMQTTLRDPNTPDDDGLRAVYIKGQMQAAVRDAVRKAGASGLEVGGTLTVSYTGNGEAKQRGFNPPKLYAATYQALNSSGAFLGTAPAAPVTAQQPYSPPPAAPAQPVDNSPEAWLRANGHDPATFGPGANLASIVALMQQTGAQKVA